jgi:hypothetical protein
MLYRLGRAFQLVGLLLLPLAMAGNVSNNLDLRQMLAVAGLGIGIFSIGWLLQQAGGK